MRAEPICADVRPELSAHLDGELDAAALERIESHLSTCPDCRRYESELKAARRAVRVQPVGPVPDLTDTIMARVRTLGPSSRRRDDLRAHLRTGLIAAAAAALLVVGVTTPFVDRPADIAAASEIVRKVKDAARALTSYTATFTITEHNWHPDVDVRRFKATVWFEAPERFRLQVRDLTTYPDPQRWPRNDVDLVASPRAWWIEEPFSCPAEALPDCAVEADEQQRSIVNRGPFDGTTALPTDIVVPVETISAATDFQVIRTERVLGRRAHRIELTYRQALPLIGALQPGGSWRPFHPLDKVELWIDRETSVPLRYRVIAGSFSERVRWSETNFVFDEPGEVLLDVEATSFGARDLRPRRFQVPRSGTRIDAGFTPGSFAVLGEGPAPSYRAGLEPYRAGTSPRGIVLSYEDGLKWLRLTYERGAGAAPADLAVADEIALGTRSFAYYRPADESLRRTVDIFGRRLQIHIESNLARDPLIDVAQSLAVRGQRIEPPGSGTRVGARFFATRAWALAPTYLPAGYDPRPSAAVLYEPNAQRSLVAYHRNPEAEYDGFGIRITQRTGASLPPSSESFLPVNIHGVRARWSPERSEIEWVDGGIYRAVRAPSFDLATVVEIARGLK